MATLYKQPKSLNWYAKFFDATGKRVARSTGTPKKRDAQKIAEDMEGEARAEKRKSADLPKAFSAVVNAAAREARDGTLSLLRAHELIAKLHRAANPDFGIVSVSDHFLAWIKTQKVHVGVSTHGVYMDAHRHMTGALGPRLSAGPVGEVTTAHIVAALDILKGQGLKGTTINLTLGTFRRVLHTAVADGLARLNPALNIRPLPETDSVERAPFTIDEVCKMITHPSTSHEWQGMILLGVSTGLRLGDVVCMNTLNVIEGRLVVRPQKTKKRKSLSTLTIPLSKDCLDWLEGKEGEFFPELSKKVIGTLSTKFKAIMKVSEVPDRVAIPGGQICHRSFHSLRHSFVSWLAGANIAADVRQKLTGHISGGIHARYTHHDEALDAAISSLPKLT
jgi:integrase